MRVWKKITLWRDCVTSFFFIGGNGNKERSPSPSPSPSLPMLWPGPLPGKHILLRGQSCWAACSSNSSWITGFPSEFKSFCRRFSSHSVGWCSFYTVLININLAFFLAHGPHVHRLKDILCGAPFICWAILYTSHVVQ